MRRTLSRSAFVAAAVLASACAGATDLSVPLEAPTVQVLPATTTPGAQLGIRLTNPSTTSWLYNRCGSPRLQHLVNGRWVEAAAPVVCTMEISTLGVGSEAERFELGSPDQEPGTYRISYHFVRTDGEPAKPVSNTFIVQ